MKQYRLYWLLRVDKQTRDMKVGLHQKDNIHFHEILEIPARSELYEIQVKEFPKKQICLAILDADLLTLHPFPEDKKG